ALGEKRTAEASAHDAARLEHLFLNEINVGLPADVLDHTAKDAVVQVCILEMCARIEAERLAPHIFDDSRATRGNPDVHRLGDPAIAVPQKWVLAARSIESPARSVLQ